ncbi:MAG TPA: ankyrin repeat domain-containing protein [Candidatus Hydrogenedentes bacterium]|nr:ankyrin repeat domain-containing protein [Candidatus Hydrogenedentota bacterium]HIO21453.1 ankyrin repeat domain-containing protein [Nitrospirales bacterium]
MTKRYYRTFDPSFTCIGEYDMNRWLIGLIVVVVLLLLLPIVGMFIGGEEYEESNQSNALDSPQTPKVSVRFSDSPIHIAARDGKMGAINDALASGATINAQDEFGKTPLHYSAENGHGQTSQTLVSKGANPNIRDSQGYSPYDLAIGNGHSQTAANLASLSKMDAEVSGIQRINPSLNYRDLASFEQAIGQPGTLLKSKHVWLFAPKSVERGAEIVHPYLVNAYDALYEIVGVHTRYIIVVYNFPKGHSAAFGGTSNCTIWYDDSNLRLDQHEEWRKHRVPHVSGYIEEMAHNFNFTQFGWEMVGWTIGIKASQQVADNPRFQESLVRTRNGQRETYERYRRLDFTFPSDIPENQVDRIHAYILNQCEQQYGAKFWHDFFLEAKKQTADLNSASRDERYRITINCFDSLPGLNFKEMLRENHISLTTDIKSMNPEKPGWNRKLQ